MDRAKQLVVIAAFLGGCRPPPIDDAGDADSAEGGNECASAMVFEGQCFEPVDIDITRPMVAGDIDGDGRDELFVASPERLSWFELQGDAFVLVDEIQTSTEGFQSLILLADLEGDGHREIVAIQEGGSEVFRVQEGGLEEIAAQPELGIHFPIAVGPIDGRELLLAENFVAYQVDDIVVVEWQDGALVKTSTVVGSAGCWVDPDVGSIMGDFDANGIVDAAFGFGKGDCPLYPTNSKETGLLLVLVQPDGSFLTSEWHEPFGGIGAGELDGAPGDELLIATSEGTLVFEGGPNIGALVPRAQTIAHFGEIGNLGGDDRNEMVIWSENGIVIMPDPLESSVVRPFFGSFDGWPRLLADFNGDRIADLVLDAGHDGGQWDGSRVWVSK